MCPPPDMANSLPVVHDGKTSGYQLKPWVTLNGFQYSTGIKINNVLDVLPPESIYIRYIFIYIFPFIYE